MFDKLKRALIIESKWVITDDEVKIEEERIKKETGRRVFILRNGYTLKDS